MDIFMMALGCSDVPLHVLVDLNKWNDLEMHPWLDEVPSVHCNCSTF